MHGAQFFGLYPVCQCVSDGSEDGIRHECLALFAASVLDFRMVSTSVLQHVQQEAMGYTPFVLK